MRQLTKHILIMVAPIFLLTMFLVIGLFSPSVSVQLFNIILFLYFVVLSFWAVLCIYLLHKSGSLKTEGET